MSQSREILDRSVPLATYPSDGEYLFVPKKPGTKRTVSQAWDSKYSDLDSEQLLLQRKQVGHELSEARKRLKRQVPMNAEYWQKYSEVARLVQEQSQIESQKCLGDALQEQKEAKDWYETEEAETLKLRYNSWKQVSSIMEKHRKKLQDRLASGRESWVRLFTSSKLGMGLATNQNDMGMGKRDSTDQGNFKKRLIKFYSPNPPALNYKWDPVVHAWFTAEVIGAHLFPYKQGMFMDDIFGKGASDELFRPENGLLLHTEIKYALDKGWVAIVPDIELEPADPDLPANDQEARCERVKAWEKQEIKEYKLIVLNTTNSRMTRAIFLPEHGVSSIKDLDGRSLEFITNFRPRARYIWWTYLNAILRNAWTRSSKDGNMEHMEVRKCTRYWGSRGSYVKQNQILGFVEELGHEVESILEFDKEEVADEPRLEALGALVGNAMVESQEVEDEDDWVTTDGETDDEE
ncbi:hypothetical protein FBEOM_12755 [Fusarium beomiforme]|uniref:HNH nuclease domain-containing protein n=1 Tax=Fusarium beomiforme TaxID=44412 RepID=A0A9P5A700_9HYPO|nr:hypothetical protein FBEOM_12755 [Fusarium beomiforme]